MLLSDADGCQLARLLWLLLMFVTAVDVVVMEEGCQDFPPPSVSFIKPHFMANLVQHEIISVTTYHLLIVYLF
jgi:hypothetical protein